jgi:hypothetical protein
MAIHAANMCAANAYNRMLHRRACDVFGCFYSLLNGRDRLVQFYDHAFARAARWCYSVPAVAQPAVANLYHERASLRAAHVNRCQEISLLIRH